MVKLQRLKLATTRATRIKKFLGAACRVASLVWGCGLLGASYEVANGLNGSKASNEAKAQKSGAPTREREREANGSSGGALSSRPANGINES